MYTCAYCKKPTKQAPTLILETRRVYPSCCADCATNESDPWQAVPLAEASPEDIEQAIVYTLKSPTYLGTLRRLETF